MRRLTAAAAAIVLIAGACSSSGSSSSPAGSTGTGGGASTSPAASTGGESTAPSGGGFDPASISGTAVLSGWQSSDAENKALQDTVAAFQTAYPNVKVDYKVITGDYPTVMATNFASKNVPDVFYVDASFGQPWADQGFLEPLDDYIAKQGFDTSTFFPGYLSPFKGSDGKTYGLPKDGNTIGMAYNTAEVPTAPTTLDELVSAATALKGKDGLKAPMCLNPGLDRGLTFIYAQGGHIVSDDGTQNMVDTPETKAAVQWYLDLFKNGIGMTASDMGDDWCGTSLGKKHAAITFEGGWLDPAMTSTYPDVKYAWGQVPTGSSGSPVTISYTAAYAIGADSKNKDQAWTLIQYLVGKDGMTKWTEGGVALPSRSDVPTPKGKDVLVAQAQFAKPGSGFMKNYADVQKAFQDAFTKEIQDKTYNADKVIEATKAAVDTALAS
ncbi:MAG TPA: sugar ABC transporter substrate-binding protein [Candidatus Limnocylindrales bacterium]|nr:sugar ABC transporter substrate-binding protein [Candidatus Limnocylindrales bacterium]